MKTITTNPWTNFKTALADKTHFQTERSSSYLKILAHLLRLRLDASLNISTPHIASTSSAFEIILQLTLYLNKIHVQMNTESVQCLSKK